MNIMYDLTTDEQYIVFVLCQYYNKKMRIVSYLFNIEFSILKSFDK